MAKQYRRPLVAFYLAGPPRKGDRGQDFRTLPEGHNTANEVLLDALLRDVHARQALLRAALDDEDPRRPLPFIGSMDIRQGVPAALNALDIALRKPIQAYRATSSAEVAFQLMRQRVEDLSVFVVLLGNLGSHHTALNLETFRGLAIADPVAPFVVINDQDSRAAWSFSLIHELTHLFLGQTGISGGSATRGTEQFCNDVAAEFLMPIAELTRAFLQEAPTPDTLEDWISELATETNVSRTMLAYRLYSRRLITQGQWNVLREQYRNQWLASRDRHREAAREREGGPNFYVVRRQRLGGHLLATTNRLLAAGTLTTAKTARVLGVKPTQVGPLLGMKGLASPAEK